MPGISDPATLKMASELCGQASFKERGHERGRDYRVWHDVMAPDMIRQLPAGHALIIRGGQAPVVARIGAAWRDRRYKRARRLGNAMAALVTTPGTASRTLRSRTTWPPRPASASGHGTATRPDDPGDAAYPWI